MEIDGYSIVRELSRGPITTVYLGRQQTLASTDQPTQLVTGHVDLAGGEHPVDFLHVVGPGSN